MDMALKNVYDKVKSSYDVRKSKFRKIQSYDYIALEKLTDMTLVPDFCNCFLCPFLKVNWWSEAKDFFQTFLKKKNKRNIL